MGDNIDIVDPMPSTIIMALGTTPIVFATAMTIGISSVTVTTFDIRTFIAVSPHKSQPTSAH